MLAMQYHFGLPADYDMAIIDRRVAEKGRFTDGLPGLAFKAYLSTRKTRDGARDNCYAPFYLWDSTAGMNDFLAGPGFGAVSQSFGWPEVKTWSVWHAQCTVDIERARFATRELLPIPRHARLGELRAAECTLAQSRMTEGKALACVAGFEPTTWTIVRFQLWEELPPHVTLDDDEVYTVGHVSRSSAG